MIVVVMGVAGCGKTTLARALCERLGWTLCDADDLHPPANVAAMRAGRPLTDADRAPWLDAIAALHADWQAAGISGATACSALRAAYRARLRANGPAFLVFKNYDAGAFTHNKAITTFIKWTGSFFWIFIVSRQCFHCTKSSHWCW